MSTVTTEKGVPGKFVESYWKNCRFLLAVPNKEYFKVKEYTLPAFFA
jgi:hypothetical protein